MRDILETPLMSVELGNAFSHMPNNKTWELNGFHWNYNP